MATLHRDPQSSPSIPTFLLAPWEVSSTLNSTAVCREADVPLLRIPSDPVPEMDKLKISLTSKPRSTFPLIIREAWEWLQGCKQLNLEARGGGGGVAVEATRADCIPEFPSTQKMDRRTSGSFLPVSPSASISSSFPPSLHWGSSSQAANACIIYRRGCYLRSYSPFLRFCTSCPPVCSLPS